MFEKDFHFDGYNFPHFKFLKLCDGLFISGVGGAPPGSNINNENVWKGFPWNLQEEMKEYV